MAQVVVKDSAETDEVSERIVQWFRTRFGESKASIHLRRYCKESRWKQAVSSVTWLSPPYGRLSS